jgi:hypothetical protein
MENTYTAHRPTDKLLTKWNVIWFHDEKKWKESHVNSIKTIGINRFNCNKLRLMSDHFKQMSLYVDYIETDIVRG